MLISEYLLSQNTPLAMPCSGKGICKKCLVKMDGVPVLACQTRYNPEATITLDQESVYLPKLSSPTLAIPAVAPLYSKWGVSVDIGTTTIHMMLVGRDGSTASLVRKNPQVSLGADVMSRIERAVAGQGALLTNSVRTALREMIDELAARMKIKNEDIDGMVVTGNTTMLYLLCGLNPEALSKAPFEADSLFGNMASPEALELYIAPSARIYLARCISAFIGADIVTALLANEIAHTKKTTLLVDIGTNGELVLLHEGMLYCAGTAAGPVFEGYSLSGGSYAGKGAIDRVWVENGKLAYLTIDNAPATGICGSGIIEALAALLELGLIEENGYMEEDAELAPEVLVTKDDVRQIQLAKGAIRAGIETLIVEAGIEKAQIEAFFVSGDFGSFINMKHAATIGLVPAELLPVLVNVGNSAHKGATMLLQNQGCLGDIERLTQMARVVKLNEHPLFVEKFMEYISF